MASSSYLSQLYTLAKTGQITWNLYKSLKSASPAKQKAALKASSGRGTTIRRQETVSKLRKDVKNIKHQLNNDFAYHTNRNISSGVMLSVDNLQSTYHTQLGLKTPDIDASLAALRYYDPANPTTLVTADGASGNFSRQMTIKNVNTKVTYRNNYQVPVTIVLYECSLRQDTNLSPITAWANGMNDQMATSVGTTGMYMYPSDSEQFKELWSIKKTTTRRLQPGSAFEHSHNSGQFTYDPSVFDSSAINYQKEHKAHVWLIRLFGDPAHDSTNLEHGVSAAGLDWVKCITTKIEYDAGTSLNDFSVTNSLDVFSNSAVVSNKPISDNQAFEVA